MKVDVHAHLSAPGERPVTIVERLAHMDRVGTDVQVLSVATSVLGGPLDAADARSNNESMASVVGEQPSRFAGLAVLPLDDVAAATSELDFAVQELGLKGATLGSHAGGRSWDEPELDEIFEAAARLGAVLFFHAITSVLPSRTSRHALEPIVGAPLEDALVVAALIFGGVFDRHPSLKVLVAHGGGPACFDIGRIDRGWQVKSAARERIRRPPSHYLDRLHYDTLTWSEPALRFLVDKVGSHRVLMGSGWPGDLSVDSPAEWIGGLATLSPDEKHEIRSSNAARLFALT